MQNAKTVGDLRRILQNAAVTDDMPLVIKTNETTYERVGEIREGYNLLYPLGSSLSPNKNGHAIPSYEITLVPL